jgi:LuxR family maltose regulon positive regulatory protein
MATTRWEPAATTLAPPLAAPVVLERARLLQRLDEGAAGCGLTLVLGYPGAGKTVLLRSWLVSRSDRRFAWLSCEGTDADPTRFWTALVAAVRRVDDQFGADTLDALELGGSDGLDAITTLTNELGELADPFVIALDDLHFASDQRLWPTLTAFVERLPANVHLIIASRVEPVLPLHRWRIEGRLCEIRSDDLMLTEDEVAALLSGLGAPADAATVALLTKRTEGWVAGVQLAALSVRGHDDWPAFAHNFSATDRNVTDYLVGEALDRQPPDLVEFLLQTSVLDELEAEVCEALTGCDAGRLLREIEASSLFLVPLDHERRRYRYHHLFGEMLRLRLRAGDPERVVALHRTAAEWYDQHGRTAEAVRQFLRAGAFDRALDIMRSSVMQDFFKEPPLNYAQLVDSIDATILADQPELAVEYALALALAGDAEAAGRWFERLEQAGIADSPDDQLRGRFLGARAMWLGLVGAIEDAGRELERAQALLDSSEDDLSDNLVVAEIRVAHYLDDLDGVRLLAAAENRARRRSPVLQAMVLPSARSAAEYEAGYLHLAERLARDALAVAADIGAHDHLGRADALRALGGVLLERNDIDEAERLLEESVRVAEGRRPPFEFVSVLEQAWLFVAQHQIDDALETVARARTILPRPSPVFTARADVVETRLHLLIGEIDAAERISTSMPAGTRKALSNARVALARHRPDAVRACLDSLDSATLWPRHALERALLETRLAILEHRDREDVDELLELALGIAEREGYVRTIVLESPDLGDAFDQALRRAPIDSHTSVIASAFEQYVTPALRLHEPWSGATLSQRELTVLRYLASRMSNREIASELYISLNTLKTHVKSIYRKLDVSSRSEAVAAGRARALL